MHRSICIFVSDSIRYDSADYELDIPAVFPLFVPHFVNTLLLFFSQAFEIETFATKVGVKRIAQGASLCLLANYVHAIATGLLAPAGTFKLLPMVGGHFILGLMLIQRFKRLDPDSMPSIKTYYKNIWDLFYLEYGLYTLI